MKQVTVTWDDKDTIDVTFGAEVEANDLVAASFLLARIANRLLDVSEYASIKEPTIIPASAMPHNGDH